MIDLQDIITTKRELLSRATCSLSPINYSAGMAEDQKERYIQYLAEQNQDLRLTSDAMKLVLEDFMAQMKDLKAQVSSMESKHADLENRLSYAVGAPDRRMSPMRQRRPFPYLYY